MGKRRERGEYVERSERKIQPDNVVKNRSEKKMYEKILEKKFCIQKNSKFVERLFRINISK